MERFTRYASAAGWQEHLQRDIEAGISPAVSAPAYVAPLQIALANAMLCASLELDESDALAAIADIARQARRVRFEKPPAGLSRKLRALYRDSARIIARALPEAADLFEQVFARYVRGDYDHPADANALLSQARSLKTDRAAALDAVSRAGVAMLRGAPAWPGWFREGDSKFQHWAFSLLTMAETYEPLRPLGPAAEERARAAERITLLSDDRFSKSDDERELPQSAAEAERIADTWLELAERNEPLSDDEIRAMGDQYALTADLAARIVASADILTSPGQIWNAGDEADEDDEADETGETLGLAVDVMGILRYGTPGVIRALIDIAVGYTGDDLIADLPDRAIVALQRIGAPVLQQCFDFIRYSEDEYARLEILRVLGAAGRGNEEVYQYLVGAFERATWAEGKRHYALPLALLHDARAVPLIVAALRDPAVDDEDARELLDALQELGVTFYVNKDQRAVNIPEYGVIEDVLPYDWQSRAELQALDEAWDDFGLNEDEDEDEEGEDDYDDVVYDADGTPRCPDCGQEMHYVDGRWVHEPPPATPKRPKSKSRY